MFLETINGRDDSQVCVQDSGWARRENHNLDHAGPEISTSIFTQKMLQLLHEWKNSFCHCSVPKPPFCVESIITEIKVSSSLVHFLGEVLSSQHHAQIHMKLELIIFLHPVALLETTIT